MAIRNVDIQTLLKARDGDDNALKLLAAQFDGVIKGVIKSYFIRDGDRDDLYQMGLIGLGEAVKRFDPSKNSNFVRYARLCIYSKMKDAVKKSNREKNLPLNTAVDFTEVQMCSGNDPEKALLMKEELDRVLAAIDVKLSDYEKHVLYLYIDGLSYKEIASRTGKNVKSVSNAIARIRAKLV